MRVAGSGFSPLWRKFHSATCVSLQLRSTKDVVVDVTEQFSLSPPPPKSPPPCLLHHIIVMEEKGGGHNPNVTPNVDHSFAVLFFKLGVHLFHVVSVSTKREFAVCRLAKDL